MTERFTPGDRVRIDIPDESDPDFDRYHRETGRVVKTKEDDAGDETGDPRDSVIYSIDLDDGPVIDFRWRDLRPSD